MTPLFRQINSSGNAHVLSFSEIWYICKNVANLTRWTTYHAIIHLTFRLLGIYVETQVQTSDGRVYSIVQTQKYVYAFDFKLNESAEKALQQVKDKKYLEPYLHHGKSCIGIGVNFSKEEKKVQEILWEEVS